MNIKLHRRYSMKTGPLTCCFLLLTGNFHAAASGALPADEKPDQNKMSYCGLHYPEGCQFLAASLKNDPELEKEANEIEEIKERFGVETFEADKTSGFDCKNKKKPVDIRLHKYDVKACAINKN